MCSTRKRETNKESSSSAETRAPPRPPRVQGKLLSNWLTGSLRTPPTLDLFFLPARLECGLRLAATPPWFRPLLAQLRPSAPRATGSKHGGSRGSGYRPRCGGIRAGPAACVLRGRMRALGIVGVLAVPRTGGRGVVSDKIPSGLGAGPSHRDSYEGGRRAFECRLLGLLRVRVGAGT